MVIRHRVRFRSVLFALAILTASALRLPAQTNGVATRITQAVDEGSLVLLRGNVHPLTRGAVDAGAVDDAQPLTRMLLLLQRSSDQESALLRLLDEQHTKSSPNYHKWLVPEQFGQQFGPADGDIQAVTTWLQSQGFQVTQVSKGRTVIEFSGNVAQIRNAFHTQIHRYLLNGEEHLANASDPQIPAALTPVVAGVVSLHDFQPATHIRVVGAFHRSTVTGEITPLFTPVGNPNVYPLAPGDFAKIYNVSPLLNASPPINGSGQTIAIVGESDIHVQDIVNFRNLFGLPQNFTSQNVIVNGPDPGFNGSEIESDLDTQWTGAVAPGATIDFVTSASTETTSGVHLSAVYAVDNNLAGVMSESFGECEQHLGSAGNQFYYSLWEQAAAQGITVILSAGDGGSAGCDNFDTQQTAKQGLAVSGFASTPFNVAAGGTDFDQINRWPQYWNQTNDPVTQASVKGYIPEIPWNDSCAQLGISGCGASAPQGSLNIVAGSGGPSTLYSKPVWQSGAGVPQDQKRDVPDVSLFASNGFTGSVYIICQSDGVNPPIAFCNLNQLGFTFKGVGGTSAAAPAFAGLMALVNQKQATAQDPSPRQGIANYVLYALAAKQAAANLNCDSSAGPDARCTFNDVTRGNSALANSSVGNNSVPCSPSSPNCSSGAGADGILVDPANTSNPAWTTNAGYDLTTGLGSVNAQNLVNNWDSGSFLLSTTSLNASINGQAVNSVSGLVHGLPISVMSTVAAGPGAAGTPTGLVSLIASPNPASGSPSPSLGIEDLTLASGTATGANIILPGGTYTLAAHYPGDGIFGPSDSSPGIPVNITAENSKTLISIPVFDSTTGLETGNTLTSVVYGTQYYGVRVDVGNAQAVLSFPPQPTCNPPSCPTGTLTLSDAINGGASVPFDGGIVPLNNAGFAEDLNIQLSGGSHQLSASYSGDSSYVASSSSYAFSVTPAATTTTAGNPPLPSTSVTPFFLNAIVRTGSLGNPPSCSSVTFFDGNTPVPGTVSCTGQSGGPGHAAFLQPALIVSQATSGSHTYTAKFNGDSNYSASAGPALTTQVFNGTTMMLSADKTTVQYGSNVTLTAVVDTSVAQGPAISNAITFATSAGPVLGTVVYTPIKDTSGNIALRATLTTPPQSSGWYTAFFAGDMNYYQSTSPGAFITVNIPGFTVAASPASLSVIAGQSGMATITVTPLTNSTTPVTLSCANRSIPIGSVCSFVPPTLTLSNGNSATATFTVTTLPPSGGPTVTLVPPKPVRFQPFSGDGWGPSTAAALVCLLLLLLPRRSPRYRLATGLVSMCVFGFLISCGSGGGTGGPGGGGGANQVSTSISLTTSGLKVPSTAPPTIQAKVSSTRTVTGTVTFYDAAFNPLVASVQPDGTATMPGFSPYPGTHVITASYSGDGNNLPSKTNGALNQVITGTIDTGVVGTTGGLSNGTTLPITIQ